MLDAFLQDPRLDLDAPCHVGSYTALHYALQFLTWAGNPPAPAPADIPAILGRLLAAGADPRVEDGHGRTPMAWAGSVWDEAMARGDMVVVDAAMASMELLQVRRCCGRDGWILADPFPFL